jgi:hypothetical protein
MPALSLFAFLAGCFAKGMLAYPVPDAPPNWRLVTNGDLPLHSFVGGHEDGRTYHICRAVVDGQRSPGKVVEGQCSIGWDGEEKLLSVYEVLHASPAHFMWTPAERGGVPDGAYLQTDEQMPPICRAMHNDSMQPGKVSGHRCKFSWRGGEFEEPEYEVLVLR